jgi:hypothetical protein
MKPMIATLRGVAVVMALCLGSAVRAEDAGPSTSSKASQKIDQDINQAAGIVVDKSSSDLDSEVKDLDATRAAIDQRKVPAISLSVSGSVGQQVQYNLKQ